MTTKIRVSPPDEQVAALDAVDASVGGGAWRRHDDVVTANPAELRRLDPRVVAL